MAKSKLRQSAQLYASTRMDVNSDLHSHLASPIVISVEITKRNHSNTAMSTVAKTVFLFYLRLRISIRRSISRAIILDLQITIDTNSLQILNIPLLNIRVNRDEPQILFEYSKYIRNHMIVISYGKYETSCY